MNIYPKTCRNFQGLKNLESYVLKNNGIELQFFNENGIMAPFEFNEVIEKLLVRMPNIKEITIHPPLNYYEIEYIIAKDKNIIINQCKNMVALARKHNIKINMVYHTKVNINIHKELTFDTIKEILEILKGTDVKILFENLYMFFEDKCTVYEIADYFDSPNLRVCLDVCHLYCKAHIYKQNIESYLKSYLDPELCKKYTYQVHFAYTANNDGYIDHKTHGIMHPDIDEVRHDVKLLKKYNITFDNANFVTEVSEKDYDSRKDQCRELEMLEKVASER